MSITTKEQAHSKAKALAGFLATQGCNLGYRKALDAVAVTEGLKNWNVLSARPSSGRESSRVAPEIGTNGTAPEASEKHADTGLHWEADMVRIALGYQTFRVDAQSLGEALDEAHRCACDTYFLTNDSTWYLSTVRCGDEHHAVPPYFQAPEYAHPDNSRFLELKGLQRYEIQVTRIGIGFGKAEYEGIPEHQTIFEALRNQGEAIGASDSNSEYLLEVLSRQAI